MQRFCTLVLTLCFFATAVEGQTTVDTHPSCGFRMRSLRWVEKRLFGTFDTLRFLPGERIADIGAQGGDLAGWMHLYYPGLDVTLEDIDSSCTNPTQVERMLRHYAAMRKPAAGPPMVWRTVVGNDTGTTLPTAAFAKVFMMNTYHEISRPAPMLADLHRITAPGGTLYVTELVSTRKQMKHGGCNRLMPVEQDFLKAFRVAGFRLENIRVLSREVREGDAVRNCCFRFRKV